MPKCVVILGTILFGLLAATAKAQTESFSAAYQKAAAAYYEKNYDAAIRQFHDLLADRPANGPLLYNIGNSYYQKGELARARVHYEKAKIVMPRFSDLRANLQQLRTDLAAESPVTPTAQLTQTLCFWTDWLTTGESQAVSLGAVALFCAWTAYGWWRGRLRLGLRLAAAFLLCGYLVFGALWSASERRPGRYAIVTAVDAALRPSYLDQAAPILNLPAGERVEIIDTQDFSDTNQWVRLRLADGQSGWTPRAGVTEI